MSKLNVVHLMRTYGSSGGEHQLSQYFQCQHSDSISESFVFVSRDDKCAKLFLSRSPYLKQFILYNVQTKGRGAWLEFFLILPLLIFLQIKFLYFIINHRTDIVIVHGFQAALISWPSVLLFKNTRWCYMHRVTKVINFSRHVFRLIYKPFDVLIGNSQAVSASLVKISGPARVVTIENGLNLDGFDLRSRNLLEPTPQRKGPILVSVGRLMPHKGHAVLIKAFELVVRHFPNATLWILGDGPEEKNLKMLASLSDAAKGIHFLGRREDVPAVLIKCDLFVNASTWEGMSNAVLEAMAAKLPSVVVDSPGVSECHINGQTGLIVKNDPFSIAEGVRSLLENVEASKQMGILARNRVGEYYSISRNCDRFLNLFSKLSGHKLCAES